MNREAEFERLVTLYYQPLYRFALSLTRDENNSCDLTQEAFRVWANKGHQLQEPSKVKAWLFTTLHRLFLETRRRQTRFPNINLDSASEELPHVDPASVNRLDARQLVDLLERIDEPFQAPIALFYLEEHSYNEIAAMLEIPLGTVKSRIARGLGQLKLLLAELDPATATTSRRSP